MAVKKFAATPEQISSMEFAVSLPDTETQPVPAYRSYPSAVVRGIGKGLLKIGQEAGDPRGLMLGENGEELPPEEALKMYAKLKEQQTQGTNEFLNRNLPIGQNLGPRMVERGVKSATESLPNMPFMGPIASPLRTGIGGAAAEAAKEIGVGDLGQAIVEIVPQLFPDLGKKILNTLPTQAGRAESALMDEARRLGLSEEELSLVLNQRGPVKDFLQNIAYKGGRVPERFQRTKNALGRVWDTLRGTPEAQAQLTGKQSADLINGISQKLSRMPSAQRALIAEDLKDFLGSQMKGTDIMDFWSKLNYYIAKGEGKLGTLKDDLGKAITAISPELGKDFELTNKLYGNFQKLSERMAPSIADSLINKGEAGAVVVGITTGNYPLLRKILGVTGATNLATEMTTNPRLMNLSSRFISAIGRDMPQVAKNVYDQMLVEVGKTNAEAAVKMSEADFDELYKALPKEKKSK